MKILLLIGLILIKPNTQKQEVPSNTKPHQQTILNPTRPTDNPTNLIRNCNLKIHLTKQISK